MRDLRTKCGRVGNCRDLKARGGTPHWKGEPTDNNPFWSAIKRSRCKPKAGKACTRHHKLLFTTRYTRKSQHLPGMRLSGAHACRRPSALFPGYVSVTLAGCSLPTRYTATVTTTVSTPHPVHRYSHATCGHHLVCVFLIFFF